jgi:hypothetical protein
LNYEHFNQTRFGFSDLTNLWNLYSNASDYSTSVIDHFYFQEDGWDSYSTRTHGYFVPPHTGDYTLHIKSDDEAILFFSMDEDPANKVFMSILMLKLFTTDLTNYHNSVVMFYKKYIFIFCILLCHSTVSCSSVSHIHEKQKCVRATPTCKRKFLKILLLQHFD